MANPQKENGYVPIANEIMEAFGRFRISGVCRQCLDIILRKTYGFNKKADHIALSQFCALSNLTRANVCHALRKLAEMNIIIVKIDNGKGNIYRFNKNFDAWKPLSNLTTVVKIDNRRCQNQQSALLNLTHTKDTITKDTITKDTVRDDNKSYPQVTGERVSGPDIIKRILKNKYQIKI